MDIDREEDQLLLEYYEDLKEIEKVIERFNYLKSQSTWLNQSNLSQKQFAPHVPVLILNELSKLIDNKIVGIVSKYSESCIFFRVNELDENKDRLIAYFYETLDNWLSRLNSVRGETIRRIRDITVSRLVVDVSSLVGKWHVLRELDWEISGEN